MRWLVHGNVSPAAVEALRRHEQIVQTLAEIELKPEAPLVEIVAATKKRQLELITTDDSLLDQLYGDRKGDDVRISIPPNRVVVYLQLPGGDVEQDDAIDRLFKRYKRLNPGRLYTVTESRVKVRQLPGFK